jgi:glucose-1-phosphate adenylyltransferase
MSVDSDNRVTGFEEKPTATKIRAPQNPDKVPASMGIYLFNTDVLIPILLKDAEDEHSSHDFGKDILPKMVDDYRVYSYDFVDENKKEALYWRDVGTLEAYYDANMDIASVSPVFNLYDETWPIRTHHRQSLCSKSLAAPARLSTPSFLPAASFRAAPCATAFSLPTCASIPTPKSNRAFCFRT